MVLTPEEIEKRINDSYEIPNNVLHAVPEPMVTVRTSTYQHGPYIKDCIEGVLMQKTTFPIEFIIGEDFSTDGTREIVFEYAKKFPDIIRVITADYNVGSKANGRRCIKASRGKYMAICEGDDYWTDPYKLQKQVDFLEANPDYGLIHTNFKVSNGNRRRSSRYNKRGLYLKDFLIGRRTIGTLTMVFRKDVYEKTPKYYMFERFKIGDLPLCIELAKESKIKYLNECTAMYRVLDESASHSNTIERVIDFQKNALLIRLFYIKKYELPELRRKTFKSHYSTIVKMAYEKGNRYYAETYFKKLCKIGLPTLKAIVWYFGTKYSFIHKTIQLIYKF